MDLVERYKKETFILLENEYEQVDDSTLKVTNDTPEGNTIERTERMAVELSNDWEIVENSPDYALIEYTN